MFDINFNSIRNIQIFRQACLNSNIIQRIIFNWNLMSCILHAYWDNFIKYFPNCLTTGPVLCVVGSWSPDKRTQVFINYIQLNVTRPKIGSSHSITTAQLQWRDTSFWINNDIISLIKFWLLWAGGARAGDPLCNYRPPSHSWCSLLAGDLDNCSLEFLNFIIDSSILQESRYIDSKLSTSSSLHNQWFNNLWTSQLQV